MKNKRLESVTLKWTTKCPGDFFTMLPLPVQQRRQVVQHANRLQRLRGKAVEESGGSASFSQQFLFVLIEI